MSYKHFSTSNICNVRAIIAVQPLNGLSGFATWTSHKRTTALAVFLRAKHSHICASMVGRMGQSKDWPGSCVTGIANPVRLTTSQRFATLGGDSKITQEFSHE